jgi:SAM-dependent methyltransferase
VYQESRGLKVGRWGAASPMDVHEEYNAHRAPAVTESRRRAWRGALGLQSRRMAELPLARAPGPVRAAFDRIKDAFGGRLVREHLAFNLASVSPHVPRGCDVLDIGAWDGALGEGLTHALECRVVDADVVDKHETRQRFVLFDGQHLPLPDASFDRVLLMYVLHHSAHADALLAEARRLCRPDGRLIVAEDFVENAAERALVLGFHTWLLAFTGLGWKGQFRRIAAWHERFQAQGFSVEATVDLGRHMGRRFWPRNTLFVLRPIQA